MSLSQVRNCNLGPSKGYLTGSTGVGFTLLNSDGTMNASRTTAGVYELVAGSGLYGAYVSLPDAFHGSILWDTGETSPKYACEQVNAEENNPNVDVNLSLLQTITGTLATQGSNIQSLLDFEGGRWKINASTNRMEFYKSDNTTLIAQFDLFDINGSPTTDDVAERRRV